MTDLKAIAQVLIFLTLLSSCSPEDGSGIRTKRITYDINASPESYKDSIVYFDDKYFEISLASTDNGTTFIAEKRTKKQKDHSSSSGYNRGYENNYVNESYYIIDDRGETMRFTSKTGFLNFMSEKGYALKDQFPNTYHTDYTFIKD